jgi:hypothetical protein
MTTDTIRHLFLTQADDEAQARRKVLSFLERTELIRYEATTIQDTAIRRGDMPDFWATVEQAMGRNKKCAADLVAELQATGINQLTELNDLPQGYASKVLHTLVHILDGFIGVDSAFYNLLEDSHWLSEPLRQAITSQPEAYWLVPVVPGRLQYSVFHHQGK